MVRAIPGRVFAIGVGIVALFASGCLTEPGARVLKGTYGGVNLGLVATSTEARFDFLCGTAVTGPLHLNPSGTAHALGVAIFQRNPEPRPIIVEARRIDWFRVEVAVRIGDSAPIHYDLFRGRPPDFSGIFCL